MTCRAFLFDEMLVRLARLVRAAGHDATLAEPSAPDALLIERATGEARLLVTRDRGLAARAGDRVVLLLAERIEEQARELSENTALDWLCAPFTRCPVDNAILTAATAEQRAAMPASVQDLKGAYNACPACGRLYWPGGHVERIRARLERLAAVGSGRGGGGENAEGEGGEGEKLTEHRDVSGRAGRS